MSSLTGEKEKQEQAERKERVLRNLADDVNIMLAIKGAKATYLGLCRDCANREICRKRKPGEFVASCPSHRAGDPVSAAAFKSLDEVLAFAVEKEDQTFALYDRLRRTVKQGSTKKAFKSLAKMSFHHKKKLVGMRRAGKLAIPAANIQSLHIARYVTKDVTPHEDMGTADALLFAIKRAGAIQKLYADLSRRAEDHKIQGLFAALAQEEAELKTKLETEYDERVFAQD